MHHEHKQSPKLCDKWCGTKYKQEYRQTSKEDQARTEATQPQHTAATGTLEYSIVRDHSNHFIRDDLMPCS